MSDQTHNRAVMLTGIYANTCLQHNVNPKVVKCSVQAAFQSIDVAAKKGQSVHACKRHSYVI